MSARAGGIAILPADWPAPAQVRAFSTLRSGPGASLAPFDAFNLGLRSGDAAEAALANRARLRREFALATEPRWLHQVHGVAVVRVSAGEIPAQEPEADAAVTDVPGQPLAILSADCLPVLFCSEDGSEVGAAHAGWRGLAGGVLEAAIAAMHAPPSRLLAWLGPCAGAARYEIGEDVHAAFVGPDPGAAVGFAPTRPGHWLVDLPALARRRLAGAGVQRAFGGGECTISHPERWYSHRRDRVTGRMATLIWIDAAPG